MSLSVFPKGVHMRVCQVCSAHDEDDGRIFHHTCTSLAGAGYEVHLIAAGKEEAVYYKQGVTIHPLPACPSRRARFARRSEVAKMAADLEPDLFHVHEPELLGAVIAHARRRPVIYDVHESYRDVLMQREWIPRWARPLAAFAWDQRERQLVRHCAAVVAATERVAHRYRTLHPTVQVIANYPDLVEIQDLPARRRNPATCVFTGNLCDNRGLTQVIEALAILRERGLAVPLELAGTARPESYLERLLKEADRWGVRQQVSYHGAVSRAGALAIQSAASIALVPHLPVGNNLLAVPVKMVEGMALGLPLVYSNLASHLEFIGSSGAGLAVDPTQPGEIADAIQRLLDDPDLARRMGEAGRRAVWERYNWSAERVKLLDLYHAIDQREPRSSLQLIGHP
jgi:glycosyltransferase involved in cell wall biosynthesis